MVRRYVRVLGCAALAALLAAAAASQGEEDAPSVARPVFHLEGQQLGGGTAFFLPGSDEVGVVAITTAHAFSLEELARAEEVEFRLGRTEARVAVSSRLFASPGRPFSAPGASLRDDFLVFALDLPPEHVRVLRPDAEADGLEGQRVRLLGVPAMISQDEDDLFGTVVTAAPDRIEVRLDVPADLRGWGGAPVLRYPGGAVIGILQAAWPDAETLRLGVAPLGGVLEALARPWDGGLGRPFAALTGLAEERATAPVPGTTARRQASVPAPHAEPADATPSLDEAAPAGDEPLEAVRAISMRRMPTGPPEGEALLGPESVASQVVVEIEEPLEGAVVGDPSGAFVAGRALALLGEFKRFDVVLVLDTSGSTAESSGADINGNGVIGRDRLGGILGATDPGDSILAAEVAAARRILRGLDPRSTRVGLVTFAGDAPHQGGGGIVVFGSGPRRAALTEEPLTSEFDRIEASLDRVLQRGPDGLTHMAEGLRTAVIELKGYRGGLSEPDADSEKIALFFTDGQPTLPYDAMFEADNVRAVLRAADQAKRAGVRAHSFAIGPEALDGPVAAVEIAARTGGYFTPVRHPGDLVEVIESVSFSNIESVTVRNATTGEPASHLESNADGSFGALVPVATGRNRIEVVARAVDGSEARGEVTVAYAAGAPRADLPTPLIAQRNRLLEQRLLELRRGRVETEREAAEATRRELEIQIEREREEASRRADEQRKRLDLEVLRGDEETAPDREPPPAEAP